jgi:DNA-binding NtrC family response regulator
MVEVSSILIADDEEIFRETTADLLRLRGYRCDCVGGARTALAALDDRSFDLLIADIHMPGSSGLQLAEEVGTSHAGLPVILVTGVPSLDSAIRSVRLPVAAYLTKPLDLESFYRQVNCCIAESTARRVLRDAQHAFAMGAEQLEMLGDEVSKEYRSPAADEIARTANSAIRVVLESLQSLESLWRRYASPEDAAAIRSLVVSRREAAFQEALEYAVLVLERTRNSFKSKDLGELRLRLSHLLTRQ